MLNQKIKTMKSTFGNLNITDVLKGFILSVITALIAAVYQAIQAGTIQFTWAFWQPILYSAIGGGFAYLIKNFFTNSQDQFLKAEK